MLDKALTLMSPEEQQSLAARVLMVPGLLAKMVHSNKAAAARLLLLVQGWYLAEAHRQICWAFPESLHRLRLLHSLFGSKSPPQSLRELCATDAHAELKAPVPQTMDLVLYDACTSMVVPQQETMASAMIGASWPAAPSQEQMMWMSAPQGVYMWIG